MEFKFVVVIYNPIPSRYLREKKGQVLKSKINPRLLSCN